MSKWIASRAVWIPTIVLLLLTVGCSSGKSVSELTLSFRTAAGEALSGEVAWEGHVEAGGVDKTTSMPRLRSGYADYLSYRLIYFYDLWRHRGTSRSGNAYAWALVSPDSTDIVFVEVGVGGTSGDVLIVDRWDEIFCP